MSNIFDRILALKKPSRHEEPARGTIAVEGVDPSRSFNRYVCTIRIDGRRVAILSLFRSKVEINAVAGDHEVTIQLGLDRAEPLSIHLEPGGRVELICGKESEWIRWEKQIMRDVLLFSLPCYAMMGLGWLAYPLLRGIVVEAIYRFGIEGAAAALGHKLVLTRSHTMILVFFGTYPGLVTAFGGRSRRELNRLRTEIGPRCYLKFRMLK